MLSNISFLSWEKIAKKDIRFVMMYWVSFLKTAAQKNLYVWGEDKPKADRWRTEVVWNSGRRNALMKLYHTRIRSLVD